MATLLVNREKKHPTDYIPESLLYPYKRPTQDEIDHPITLLVIGQKQVSISNRPVYILRDPFFADLQLGSFYLFGQKIMICQKHPETGCLILNDLSLPSNL